MYDIFGYVKLLVCFSLHVLICFQSGGGGGGGEIDTGQKKMVEADGKKKYRAGEVEIVSKNLYFFVVVKCGRQMITVAISYLGQ